MGLLLLLFIIYSSLENISVMVLYVEVHQWVLVVLPKIAITPLEIICSPVFLNGFLKMLLLRDNVFILLMVVDVFLMLDLMLLREECLWELVYPRSFGRISPLLSAPEATVCI